VPKTQRGYCVLQVNDVDDWDSKAELLLEVPNGHNIVLSVVTSISGLFYGREDGTFVRVWHMPLTVTEITISVIRDVRLRCRSDLEARKGVMGVMENLITSEMNLYIVSISKLFRSG